MQTIVWTSSIKFAFVLQLKFRRHPLSNLLAAQGAQHDTHHHGQGLVPAGLDERREILAQHTAEQLDYGGVQILVEKYETINIQTIKQYVNCHL